MLETRSIPGDPFRAPEHGEPPAPRAGRRRVARVVLPVVALALLAAPHLGRAVPTNNYRPLLPPDALATGCFPLPGGADLDLPHQVRHDGEVMTSRGVRRQLLGQYDLVGSGTALERIVRAFARVGFRAEGNAWDEGPIVLRGPRGAEIRVTVSPIPGTGPGTLVRGDFLLDLPPVAATKDDPTCSDPKSTKRWPL